MLLTNMRYDLKFWLLANVHKRVGTSIHLSFAPMLKRVPGGQSLQLASSQHSVKLSVVLWLGFHKLFVSNLTCLSHLLISCLTCISTSSLYLWSHLPISPVPPISPDYLNCLLSPLYLQSHLHFSPVSPMSRGPLFSSVRSPWNDIFHTWSVSVSRNGHDDWRKGNGKSYWFGRVRAVQ